MNINYLFGIFGAVVIVAIVVFLLGRDGTEEYARTLTTPQERASLESIPINEEYVNATGTKEAAEPELESELDDGTTSSEVEDLPSEETSEEVDLTEEESDAGIIVYTNQGFSPKTIAINVGDAVTWINNSSRNMWVASAIHPTHNEYTEEADTDCGGSSFDACIGIAVGESWSFTFNKTGSWNYHDHLNSPRTGTIEVE